MRHVQVPAQVVEVVRERVLEPAARLAHRVQQGGSVASSDVRHWAAAKGAVSRRWAAASVAESRHWASASSAALRHSLSAKARPLACLLCRGLLS